MRRPMLLFFGWLAAIPSASTSAITASDANIDTRWYQAEIDFLATLQARLTGSREQNILIDHIECELQQLGLDVQSDTFNFTYNNPQVTKPILEVDGKLIETSSSVPYSGTNSSRAEGQLINIIPSYQNATPNWSLARNGIAIASITNTAADYNTLFKAWPGSPKWPSEPGVPASTAAGANLNLTAPASAGVRGIIYIWENISEPLADGQYVPFTLPDQPIPAAFVASRDAARALFAASKRGARASLDLPGHRVPNTQTRTIYTVINGTDPARANETSLLTTHTDGTNALEENGHIALLAYARRLAARPPRRTTVLVFVSGHLHYGALAVPPARASTRWLNTHRDLWASAARTAVFGSCVEHLGAVRFVEDVARNTYTRTQDTEPEMLYAATGPLAAWLAHGWRGAQANVTRVLDPVGAAFAQSGEGLPLLRAGIPEVSLVTSPAHLLKVYAVGFDERVLVDIVALERQVESFMRLWDDVDGMSADEIGQIDTARMG